jgi:hypothetical protein
MFEVLVSWFYRACRHSFTNDASIPIIFEKWFKTIMKGGHEYLDVPVYHFGLKNANYVIPMENIHNHLVMLKGLLEMRDAPFGHRGDSGLRGPYVDLFSPENRKIVESRWAEDLELTGYRFGDGYEN